MLSINSVFETIERAYRKTEAMFRALSENTVDVEATVSECMEQFDGLFLSQRTETSLKAYFRYLISDEETLRDIPFNFILVEDDYADELSAAFYRALRVITGSEQEVRTVEERELLRSPEEELSKLGGCSVYVIQNCSAKPMTPKELVAWQQAAELFERTPCIVKILRAPQEVIDTRFREVDHIYYRVFRNILCCREASVEDIESALLRALEKRGFSWTPGFAEGLSAYLGRVYPTADLKNYAFVKDMIERVVFFYSAGARTGLLLDEDCVPHYAVPETAATAEKNSVAAEESAPEEASSAPGDEPVPVTEGTSIEKDSLEITDEIVQVESIVDKYEESGKPIIKNILIISLSTFPPNLDACTYRFVHGAKDLEGTYHFQQEPFPMYLKDKLSDSGEILMLTTPETRKPAHVKQDGVMIDPISPQAYLMNAVRKIPELKNVVFKSVDVNQEAPASAVSEVVSHLREINHVNAGQGEKALTVYLGTNGGLRGIQLILEAILSLLFADGIRVNPKNVWSLRKDGEQYLLFNSAAEFRIFDFVSGINEFLNYGRIDSLKRFIDSNAELQDEAGKKLLACLKAVSEGIQYCSIYPFENGLSRLIKYFEPNPSSSNTYIQMFQKNIQSDFGVLLNTDHDKLDEIEWCIRKGFLQQAFTLVENSMPNEYLKKGLISFTQDALDAASALRYEDLSPQQRQGRSKDDFINSEKNWGNKREKEDLYAYAVNYEFVQEWLEANPDNHSSFNQQKDYDNWAQWSTPFPACSIRKKNPEPRVVVTLDTSTDAEEFSKLFCIILRTHYWVKLFRNGLMHNSEKADKGASIKNYSTVIADYTRNTRKLYDGMKQVKFASPLLTVSLAKSDEPTDPFAKLLELNNGL